MRQEFGHALSVNIPYNPLALVDDKASDDAQNDAQNNAQKLEGKIINLIIVQENVQENDEDKIIDYIRNNLDCTFNGMAKAIDKSIKTVQRIIKNSNKIKRVGSDKGGHWEVVD